MNKYKLAEWIYLKLTGCYIVQRLSITDVEQATGDDDVKYTHREMLALRDVLEDYTYEGDDWSTCINGFHDDLTA